MVDFVSSLFELCLFLFPFSDNVVVFVPLFCIVFCACFAIVSAILHRDFGRFFK